MEKLEVRSYGSDIVIYFNRKLQILIYTLSSSSRATFITFVILTEILALSSLIYILIKFILSITDPFSLKFIKELLFIVLHTILRVTLMRHTILRKLLNLI